MSMLNHEPHLWIIPYDLLEIPILQVVNSITALIVSPHIHQLLFRSVVDAAVYVAAVKCW